MQEDAELLLLLQASGDAEEEENENSRGREGSPNNTAGGDDFDELHTMDMDGESAEAVKSVTEKLEHANMGVGMAAPGMPLPLMPLAGLPAALQMAAASVQMPLQAQHHLLPPHAVVAPSPLAAATAAIAAGLQPPPQFTGPSPTFGVAGLSAFQRPPQGVPVAPRLPVSAS